MVASGVAAAAAVGALLNTGVEGEGPESVAVDAPAVRNLNTAFHMTHDTFRLMCAVRCSSRELCTAGAKRVDSLRQQWLMY